MSQAKTERSVTEAIAEVRDDAPSAFRTWAVTLGISGAMLAAMYGMAFWHEAKAEAARTMAPAAVTTPVQ